MIYDTTIIGAGPAGITAAIYASRKGMKLLVVSKNIGGNVSRISEVENYTGYGRIAGIELAKNFSDHLKKFSFDFKQSEVKKIAKNGDVFEISANSEKIKSRTAIIAAGANPKKLGIKGEEEFKNKGVVYCATCDAPLFKGKKVAVIGGGNSALESAIQLSAIAEKTFLINKNKDFKGDAALVEKLKNSSAVEIFHNSAAKEIRGEKNVKSILLVQDGKDRALEVQGVFVEIGFNPNTEIFGDFLRLNPKNEIEINQKGETNIGGIFAAGDCSSVPYKQIMIAAGSGATAAISAFNYLVKQKQ